MKNHRVCWRVIFFIFLAAIAPNTKHAKANSPDTTSSKQASNETNLQKDTAILQWVDKITGKAQLIKAVVGENMKHEQLRIKVSVCKTSHDLEAPDNISFLEIWEFPNEQLPQKLFTGWMLSSSPALSTLINPRHNIWLIKCKNTRGLKNRK